MMSPSVWLSLEVVVLLCLSLIGLARCVPSGFVDEFVADVAAISGSFAPNPRMGGRPMLLLSSKEGLIHVLEDPDNSDISLVIGNLTSITCSQGDLGLQSIRPHPNFTSNHYIYAFYLRVRNGCVENSPEGPRFRLSRFTMNTTTLELDLSTEFLLFETPTPTKNIHQGGHITFGNDGMIYVTTGDGGSLSSAAQDMRTLLGKIIRLKDDGSIPSDNPYALGGADCAKNGGNTSVGVCGEIFASGLRNPFRMAIDPNTKSKVRFYIGDVGAATWEEISVGGTDHAKANYGWPQMEGPCKWKQSRNCPILSQFRDPVYYYEHPRNQTGAVNASTYIDSGAVTGSAFVPDRLWPSQFKFLFADYTFGKIYNLIEDDSRGCRSCLPPVPGFRNETFHNLDSVVDMFFGPFKGTSALYILSRQAKSSVRRIRYTNNTDQSPVASFSVSNKTVSVGQVISMDASGSYDPDGDPLTFEWDFGDNTTTAISAMPKTQHVYTSRGEFTVVLKVRDSDLVDRTSTLITVGIPPNATMISPAVGKTFYVGEVITLRGLAVNSTGKTLPSSQLFWEVNLRHAAHWHPFLDRTAGNNFTLMRAPAPEDVTAATNSYLQVIMYAVDENGLTTKIVRTIMPQTRNVTLTSVPSGRRVLVDESAVVTPVTITAWVNQDLLLNVEDQFPYIFKSWSDKGARRHTTRIKSTVLTTTLTVKFATSKK